MSILRDRDAKAEDVIRALADDVTRYIVFIQDTRAEWDNPDLYEPGDTISWIDAPDHLAAASIATVHRDKGWPLVVIFERTGETSLREVADLSVPPLCDNPNDHRPPKWQACEPCSSDRYARALRVWNDRSMSTTANR